MGTSDKAFAIFYLKPMCKIVICHLKYHLYKHLCIILRFQTLNAQYVENSNEGKHIKGYALFSNQVRCVTVAISFYVFLRRTINKRKMPQTFFDLNLGCPTNCYRSIIVSQTEPHKTISVLYGWLAVYLVLQEIFKI